MRKILCVVLALVICSFSIFVYAQDADDLQQERDDLKEHIEEANDQLEQVQNDLSENLQQIQKLDQKIEESQIEVDKMNIRITELQTSIDEVEEKLKVAERNYKKQKDLLDNRLIAVYESSDTQYLDVLLASKNISDFLSSYFLITEIAKYDSDLLDEMQTKKKEIELTKEKLDKEQSQLSVIKKEHLKTSKILENTKIMRENYASRLSETEKDIQSKIDEYNTRFAEINSEILSLALSGIDTKYIGGELDWPVPGYTRVSSKYGMRTHPITGVYKLHTGVDISAPMGANFIAANSGIVVKAGMNSAYGNMVIIDHGGGVSTLYAHGSEILVEVGQTVNRGEPVLKVGSTGYSTGPHAHFEVRLNGIVTDPMPYITHDLIPETQKHETDNNEAENTLGENIQN